MADPADRRPGLARREVWRVDGDGAQVVCDQLAEEVPVAVHVDGAPFAVMMASPGQLDDFGLGFALTELELAPEEILAIDVVPQVEGISLDIRTLHPRGEAAEARALPGRSGCGVCGSRHIEDVLRTPGRVGPGVPVTAGALASALEALAAHQPLNAATGAVHAAAWCDASGAVCLVREDIGRHNALDKLIGALLRDGRDRSAGFALVTSRASYEMVTKAARAGIPCLAALSAPTALAVDLARACGLTLIAFARPTRHVVYSGTGSGSLIQR